MVAFDHAVDGLRDQPRQSLRHAGPTWPGSRATASSRPLWATTSNPFLRLAEQDLVRRHPLFTNRHLRGVDHHADRRRARPSRRSTMSGPPRPCPGSRRHPARDEFEGRLEQQLLGERIANLHPRAFGVTLMREIFRRERCAVDTVASGARSQQPSRDCRHLPPWP